MQSIKYFMTKKCDSTQFLLRVNGLDLLVLLIYFKHRERLRFCCFAFYCLRFPLTFLMSGATVSVAFSSVSDWEFITQSVNKFICEMLKVNDGIGAITFG